MLGTSDLNDAEVLQLLEDGTDHARALLFEKQEGEGLRYVRETEKWWWWDHDGRRWKCGLDGPSRRFSKRAKEWRELMVEYDELAKQHNFDLQQQGMGKDHPEWKRVFGVEAIRKLGNIQCKNDTLAELRHAPDIIINQRDFDSNPFLLGVENGVVDLDTGDFKEAQPEMLISKLCHADWEPEALCPLWEEKLQEWLQGDAEEIAYLQRVLGSCLIGTIQTSTMLHLFYGVAGSGKSTMCEVVQDVLGDYCYTMSPNSLVAKDKGGDTQPEIVQAQGSRLVLLSEWNKGQRIDAQLFKRLTGGDKITARGLYADPISFYPTWTMILRTNWEPTTGDSEDEAVWDRFLELRFMNRIRGTSGEDKHLREHLLTERNGILRWLVEGARQWMLHNWQPPSTVVGNVETFRRNEDDFRAFLDAECELDPEALTLTEFLRAQYVEFTGRKMSQKAFGTLIAQRAEQFNLTKASYGKSAYKGVRLKTYLTVEDVINQGRVRE